MKASVLVKEVQNIIDNEGDLDVDVSVAKQPEVDLQIASKNQSCVSDYKTYNQQYLVGDATFVVVESYEDPEEKRISIRDWPY